MDGVCFLYCRFHIPPDTSQVNSNIELDLVGRHQRRFRVRTGTKILQQVQHLVQRLRAEVWRLRQHQINEHGKDELSYHT